MFDNLKDKYLGLVANDAAQVAATATKRMFEQAMADKPAEAPRERDLYASPFPQAGYAEPTPPPVMPTVQPFSPPAPNYSVPLSPYVPPAPMMPHQVEETKLRAMAKWKATVNLRYVETITRFTRDVLGSMAASDLMVEMVERLERKDEALTSEDIALAEDMKKAVERRRKIEHTQGTVLNDSEIITIYEEIIFHKMREQNLRGELQLQDPNEFFWHLTLMTLAEIGTAGKEVIAEKVSGAVRKFKPKTLFR